MRILIAVMMIVLLSLGLTACGSSTKKKAEKKEMQSKSDARIELTNQYKECVIQAGGDEAKVKACDSYLEAIKKLK